MILAEKITKLRKQCGWSQEELAEKMNVSRQSVSKWESATSIPDLNKIIMMTEIFGVSTDYLVKDENEEIQSIGEDKELGVVKVTLEEATKYVATKIQMSKYTSIGTLFCVLSVMPLFLLLAMAEGNLMNMTTNIAITISLVFILISVSIGVSFFMRTIQYPSELVRIEEESFELAYGVKSIFKERAQSYRGTFIQKVSLGLTMTITSVAPLLIVVMLDASLSFMYLMLAVMIVMVGTGVYIMLPSFTENSAYNCVIGEGEYSPEKRNETKRTEKFGAFYWPLVTAVYIGWSLWTMDWHITWILWPVAGIAFAAIAGLISFIGNSKNK